MYKKPFRQLSFFLCDSVYWYRAELVSAGCWSGLRLPESGFDLKINRIRIRLRPTKMTPLNLSSCNDQVSWEKKALIDFASNCPFSPPLLPRDARVNAYCLNHPVKKIMGSVFSTYAIFPSETFRVNALRVVFCNDTSSSLGLNWSPPTWDV